MMNTATTAGRADGVTESVVFLSRTYSATSSSGARRHPCKKIYLFIRELLTRTISPTDALHRQLNNIEWNAGARLSRKPNDAQLAAMIAHMRSGNDSEQRSLPKLNISIDAIFGSLREITPKMQLSELVRLGILFPVVGGKAMVHHYVNDIILDRKGLDTIRAPNLSSVDFRRVSGLAGVNLDNAALQSAVFENVTLDKAQFNKADVRSAWFVNAKLSEARFEGARLDNVSFKKATLIGASFAGTVLRNIDFCGANLKDANFRGATFINCHFDADTKVEGADMRDICTEGTDWSKVDYDKAKFADPVSDDGQPTSADMVAAAMKLLNLEGDVTVEQVGRRFRELSRDVHPDSQKSQLSGAAGDEFDRLCKARDLLKAHLCNQGQSAEGIGDAPGHDSQIYLLTNG